MLHPVGSLAPRTYWTRRVVGIGIVLLVLLVGFLLLSGGGDSEAAGPAVTANPSRAAQTPQLELVPATPLDTAASVTSTSTSTSTSGPAPSGAASPTTATSAPPASSAPSATSPAATTAPPAGAMTCADSTLAVVAGSPQPSWAVSAEPTVTMTVTNAGPQACSRDVGEGAQEWLLFRGETRVWGSNDCQRAPGTDVRTLQPGDQVTLTVEWTGLTSAPDCSAPRARLAAGDYSLIAVLGGDRSEAFALTFT